MADKNFIVKNGLEVGGQEVVSSSGVVTSAALGGQTLASTDSPTFSNLTISNDLAVSGDLNLTGDLNITGDLNSLSVTDLDVTDQTITLGAGQVESASGGSGIVVAGSNASLLWDETNDVFDFNKGVTSTGNVGIGAGATSPSNLLHVQESQASSTLVYFKNASATAGSVLAVDGTGTGTGTKLFDARVSGTSKFMIYGNGTAEIARPNNSSEVPLLVLSGPQGIMRLGDGQASNGGPHGIQFDYYGSGVTDGMSLYYRTDPEHISFEDSRGTSGNKVMVIERTGNVGIGTDSPNKPLHIVGTDDTTFLQLETSSTTGSNKGPDFAMYRNSASSADGDYIGDLKFVGNTTGTGATSFVFSEIYGQAITTDHATRKGALWFQSANVGTPDTMVWTGGRLGINVDDPSYRLHTRVTSGNHRDIIVAENTGSGSLESGITVKNTAGEGRFVIGASDHVFIENATEGKDLRFLTFPSGGTTGTEAIRISHNGRVGVDIDAPNAQLHIGQQNITGDATNPALQIGGASTYRLGMYTTSEGGVIDNANGDDGLQFHTKTNGEAVRITADGNLQMIAQTSSFANPGFTYHTNNYLYCRGGSAGLILSDDSGSNTVQIIDGTSGYINFETSNGSTRMRISSDGKVFMGTSTSNAENGLVQVHGSKSLVAGIPQGLLQVSDTDSQAQGVGGGINFTGKYLDNGTHTSFASIEAYKENSTSGNYGASLLFKTRENGGSQEERMRITSVGNVGIGVTPTARLELDNPSAFTNMIEYGNVTWNQNTGHGLVAVNRGSDGYVQLQITSGAADADVFSVRYSGTGANLMHNMLSNGNALHEGQVNAGRATAYDTQGNLIVYGSGQNSLILQTPDNSLDRGIAFRNSGGAYIGNIYLTDRGSNVADLVFGVAGGTQTDVTNVNERMRITKEGVVLVNTTAAFSSGKLDVRSATANTTEVIGVKNDNSGSYNVMMKFYVQSNAVGRIDWDNTGSSMGFVNLSDARLKTVTGTAKGLSFINRLEPKTYNFKDNDWETEGLIAQEVKAAMEAEEIVVRGIREPETEDDYYGLDYGTFVPNLIQAIKELSAKNDALEARISELEG